MPHIFSRVHAPHRRAHGLALLALLGFPVSALAAPTLTPPPSMSESRAATGAPAELDLGVRPLAVVYDDAADVIVNDQRPTLLGSKVLFVNFDGVQLNACGNNNPQQNCSTIFGGTVLPFSGDAARRAAIIQSVRARVEDFGISVTNTRPQSGDYDMEVVGNWQGSNPAFAGIAPGGDCWDNTGGEVSFTLDGAGTADGTAEIILQELAHTWGLDHVDVQQDLLYPTTQGNNKTFRDECSQIVADTDLTPTSGFCGHHMEACGTLSQQNSWQEMLLIFGPSVPDTAAPTVEILSPAHGDIIDGDGFVLTIALSDDQVPTVFDTWITFESDALPEPVESIAAYAGPTELDFPVTGLPDGDYVVTVTAQDEAENPSTATITVRIMGSDVPAPADGGDDQGSDDGGDGPADSGSGGDANPGDGAGSGGSPSGDETGGSSGDGSANADGNGADSGGCSVSPPQRDPAPSRAWMLLLLLGLAPRRRAHRA